MWRQRETGTEERGRWWGEEKRENRDENTSREAVGWERVTGGGGGARGQATGEEEIRRLEIKCGNRQQQRLLVPVQRTVHS